VDKLRAAYRTTVIIGLAMMATLVIYLVIVSLIEAGTIRLKGTAMTGQPLELIKYALLGISAVIFLLIRTLPDKVLTAAGEQGKKGTGVPQQASAGAASEFGPLVTAAVVTFALCEVPALFGLVLYFLARSMTDFYLFLLISLLLFSVHFPAFSQWEEWYRKRGRDRRLSR
jgi:F0F1-type ATP synthase membrane subunit c/vacuolar-type H+-ATPase subunit K